MIISPFKRRILKITAYIFGSIAVLLMVFHFWFINHAEEILEELVQSRSNGKLKLSVNKFRFNWFSNDMQLRNAVFYSADTTAATSYRFSVERINIRVKEILPLVFEKKIVFDSLNLINPDIAVTRLRSVKDADTTWGRRASLPQEMGRVYESIQDALQVLKVNSFRIHNGKFTLINRMAPDELPVSISNIQFHLDNLRVDTSDVSGSHKILFSDNVALQTYNQDIFFPDGRHRLSFSNFRINIRNKMVEFDSCTLAASKGDSARSGFRIFFDKLRMTNIDFDTLYQKEIIKADSVYCINPQFSLDVELEKRSDKPKPPPKLNELIQQLTGDLQVAFVIVQNGSFDINTLRDGKPSSFTSDHNNFELQGLRIQKNSPKPLTVKSFAMAIRNYENFLRDSTYALRFDSVLLNTDGIYLSNFTLNQMLNDKVINSFSMPQFVLNGFSWDDLVFEQRLSAQKATLYRPVINYSFTNRPGQKNKQQDIFQTLAGIGDVIQLNNLDISDGQINVNFKDKTNLQLENATLSLQSQRIIESNRISTLQRSVNRLQFKKGFLKSGNLTAEMEDVDFTGRDGRFTAEKVYVTNKEKNLGVHAKGVAVANMQIDNNSYITEINGIEWQEADVLITGSQGKKDIAPDFVIRNIRGANTKLTTSTGNQRLSAFFETLSADEFMPVRDNKPRVTNLSTSGNNFSLRNNNLHLAVGRFRSKDHDHSEMSDVRFTDKTATDSILAVIPFIGLTGDLNAIINGSIKANAVTITRPFIRLMNSPGENSIAGEKREWPEVVIGDITILEPDILFEKPGNTGFTKIRWYSKDGKSNSLGLKNFRITDSSAITAKELLFSLHNFSFTAGGKTFNTGTGEIQTQINDFSLKSTDIGGWDWNGTISHLHAKNFLLDSPGKQGGRLEISTAKLSKLTVGTSSLLNIRQLIKDNTSFRLNEISGRYEDARNHIDWYNAGYDRFTKTLSLDSFSFRPASTKEEFMAAQKYQADYMKLRTGSVSAGPFDIDKYLADTTVDVGTIMVNNAVIEDFRDKRLPLRKDIIKPLPAALLKKIPVRIKIGTIHVNDAYVEYTELNEKTNQAGTVVVSKLDAKVVNAANYDRQPGDSLEIRTAFRLMNAIPIQLTVRQSYTDSLAGFLMSAFASIPDATVLNPVLVPLASVQVESGVADTLFMQVTGREYTAAGEMTLLYQNLKIKLLNNRAGAKRKSVKSFASFFANAFIIKKQNKSGKDAVYFERLRERSALHYLVKITLSGISSSIGLKKSRKLVRQYKKELQKRNL